MTEAELFYWLAIPVIFLGGIVISCGIYEWLFVHNPYRQAEKRRKANERFGEIINE